MTSIDGVIKSLREFMKYGVLQTRIDNQSNEPVYVIYDNTQVVRLLPGQSTTELGIKDPDHIILPGQEVYQDETGTLYWDWNANVLKIPNGNTLTITEVADGTIHYDRFDRTIPSLPTEIPSLASTGTEITAISSIDADHIHPFQQTTLVDVVDSARYMAMPNSPDPQQYFAYNPAYQPEAQTDPGLLDSPLQPSSNRGHSR